jgi:hypothetical protein
MEGQPKKNSTFETVRETEYGPELSRKKTGKLVEVEREDGVVELRPENVEYSDNDLYENAGELNDAQRDMLRAYLESLPDKNSVVKKKTT